MAVSTVNLIQGPATLYFGDFGATEPATVTTAPAAAWTDVGGTNDGVSFAINDTYSVLSVDQLVEEAARVRTERVVTIKTSMAEPTLANLRLATNEATAAGTSYTPSTGTALFLPTYRAAILDGIAPGGKRRRIIARRVLATDSIEMAYKKDGKVLIPVTLTLHYVSASIGMFKIEDEPVV